MSSATSIETEATDTTLRPWQFFLLAGMLSATGVVFVATGQSPASIIVLSLTVVAASFVAVGVYRALSPLVAHQSAEESTIAVGRRRAALEREKTLVLRSIKELEFDFAMGKIAQSDFDEMGGRLRARAIGLMRQLDAGGEYQDVIEREVESRIARIAGLKTRATGGTATTSSTCTCGASNDPDARFCKMCGTRLTAG